jgi:hypothetical protein
MERGRSSDLSRRLTVRPRCGSLQLYDGRPAPRPRRRNNGTRAGSLRLRGAETLRPIDGAHTTGRGGRGDPFRSDIELACTRHELVVESGGLRACVRSELYVPVPLLPGGRFGAAAARRPPAERPAPATARYREEDGAAPVAPNACGERERLGIRVHEPALPARRRRREVRHDPERVAVAICAIIGKPPSGTERGFGGRPESAA